MRELVGSGDTAALPCVEGSMIAPLAAGGLDARAGVPVVPGAGCPRAASSMQRRNCSPVILSQISRSAPCAEPGHAVPSAPQHTMPSIETKMDARSVGFDSLVFIRVCPDCLYIQNIVAALRGSWRKPRYV